MTTEDKITDFFCIEDGLCKVFDIQMNLYIKIYQKSIKDINTIINKSC